MTNKPNSEVELSPYVIKHWKDRGYCVHGEVAVFSRSIFLDHVAHTGPCENPDHTVGIEMKRGAGKSLRSQLDTLDRKHVVDEIWGVVIATPRSATLEKWEDICRWKKPGLLMWSDDGELITKQEPEIRENDSRYKRDGWLLLVEANKDILAGYASNDDKHSYLTHFSMIKDTLERKILSSKEPTPFSELKQAIPKHVLDPYKRKNSALGRALKCLKEDEKKVKIVKKEGRMKYYGSADNDKRWDVDRQYEDFFDFDE